MRIEANDRLLFIGDSITDCGRARPVGKGDKLGNGYVSLVDAFLTASYPERRITVLNTGISGNQVTHLAARWQSDVLDLEPAWLSIMIGTNDVWRHFDSPDPANHVSIETYEGTYREIVAKTRSRLKGLVLLTPFLVETNASDPMRAMMDRYGAVVRRLAREFDARFVDTQRLYNQCMLHTEPKSLAGDRVHPSLPGHAVLARGFLRAVEFRV